MVYEDLDQEFIDYIEHLAHQAIANVEMELNKVRECKDLLELPRRKENWEAMETADTEVDEHMKKVMSHLREIVTLTRGLETFKNGMIYNAMKDSKKVK